MGGEDATELNPKWYNHLGWKSTPKRDQGWVRCVAEGFYQDTTHLYSSAGKIFDRVKLWTTEKTHDVIEVASPWRVSYQGVRWGVDTLTYWYWPWYLGLFGLFTKAGTCIATRFMPWNWSIFYNVTEMKFPKESAIPLEGLDDLTDLPKAEKLKRL